MRFGADPRRPPCPARVPLCFCTMSQTTKPRTLKKVPRDPLQASAYHALESAGVIDAVTADVNDTRIVRDALRLQTATAALLCPLPAAWPADPPLQSSDDDATDAGNDSVDPRSRADLQGLETQLASLSLQCQREGGGRNGWARPHAPCLVIIDLPERPEDVLEKSFVDVRWSTLPFSRETVPVYPDPVRQHHTAAASLYAEEMHIVQWHVPVRLPMSAVPPVLRPDQRFPAHMMSQAQFALLYTERILAGKVLKRTTDLTQRINRGHAQEMRLLDAWFRTALSDLLAQADPTMPPSVLKPSEPRLELFRVPAPGERARIFSLVGEALMGRIMVPFARLFRAYTQRQRHLLEAQTLMLAGVLVEGRAAQLRSGNRAALRDTEIGEIVGWPDVQAGLDESPDVYWYSVPARYRALMTPLSAPDPAPLSELAPYEPADPVVRAALGRAHVRFLREHAALTAESVTEPALKAIAEDPAWPDALRDGSTATGRLVLAAVVQLCVLEHLSAGHARQQQNPAQGEREHNVHVAEEMARRVRQSAPHDAASEPEDDDMDV